MTVSRFERREERHDTAADWAASNEVLLTGEIGVETDTGKHKIGDGVTAWSGLPYFLNETQLNAAYVALPDLAGVVAGTKFALVVDSAAPQGVRWEITSTPASLSGKTLYAMGTSITAGQGASAPANSYIQVAATDKGMTLVNDAIGASKVVEQALNRFAAPDAWVPGTHGLVVIGEPGFNDSRFYGALDASATREVLGSLRALLALYESAEKILVNDARLTYSASPAWTAIAGADAGNSSGGIRSYGTNGVSVTLGFTLAAGQDSITAVHTAQSGQTFDLRYTLDGSVVRTVTYGNRGANGQVAERFTGLAAGDHTLTITMTAGVNYWILDSFLIGSATPPPVLVLAPYTLTDAGWAVSPANGSDTILADYITQEKAVVAEFGNATWVAVPSWDETTMLYTDNVHPNDSGHASRASDLETAMNALPASSGLG